MEETLSAISERLKRIRTGRNLSLEEASKLTGVSKPMLGQIERGQSVPTVATLWKIATGFKTPLSSFLEEPRPEYSVAAIREAGISEDDGRMRAYPLFAYDPVRSVEVFYIEFDAQCSHASEPHDEGVEEYLLVLTGRLRLVLNDWEIDVGERQAIRFRADVPHRYLNPFDGRCTVYNIIFYRNH